MTAGSGCSSLAPMEIISPMTSRSRRHHRINGAADSLVVAANGGLAGQCEPSSAYVNQWVATIHYLTTGESNASSKSVEIF